MEAEIATEPAKGTDTALSIADPGTKDGKPLSGRARLAALAASTFAPAIQQPAINTLASLIPTPPAIRRPEFSIITCSRDDARYAQMQQVYTQMLQGEDFEIIRIADATGLAEGYSRGIEQAAGDILVFSHDDAAPIRPFAARLRQHLRRVDIVAGAGTDRLDGPAWFTAGPPHVFGQVLNHMPPSNPPQPPFLLTVYGVPARLVTGIVAFDGFWFACHRGVFGKVGFDAAMCENFHMYDVDFSFRAHGAALKIGVATDLCLMHASSGGYGDPKWKPAADKWMEKYGDRLMPHRALGFQMTAISGATPQEIVGRMEEFVARAAEVC